MAFIVASALKLLFSCRYQAMNMPLAFFSSDLGAIASMAFNSSSAAKLLASSWR